MATNDNTTIPQKRCTKCGETFPATASHFNRDKRRLDGLRSDCKACQHAYYVANREHFHAVNREHRAKNHERIIAYKREYNAANREAINEQKRVYHARNRDRINAKKREYLAANPHIMRAQNNSRRARKRRFCSDFTAEQQLFAIEYWNNCCAYCGRQFYDLFGERVLAFDHFIPLSNQDCPGTTASNMLPACHGVDSCNLHKNARDPEEWLVSQFGKRKARAILGRIETYFEVLKLKENRAA